MPVAFFDLITNEKTHPAAPWLVFNLCSVLAAVNKVLVMNDGRAQHFGPRDEVIAALTPRQPVVVEKAEADRGAA